MSDNIPTDKMLDDEQLDGISGGAAPSLNVEADAILPSSGMGGSASPLDALPAAAPGGPTIRRADLKKGADLKSEIRTSDIKIAGMSADARML